MAQEKAKSTPKRSTLQRLQDELAAAKAHAASKVQKKYDGAVSKLSNAEARLVKAQQDIDTITASIDEIKAEADELGVVIVVAAPAAPTE